MEMLVYFFLVTFCMTASGFNLLWGPSSDDPLVDIEEKKEVKMEGDIVLGGLFPMHEMGQGGELCGAIKEEKGIQRLEAMLYAIDRINRNKRILRGIKLGVHILDTCLRDTYALEQSLEFIKAHMNTLDVSEFTCTDGNPPLYTPSKPVAGVIGAAASQVSVMVANILRLFKIPQISYSSTGIELSDKSRFEYFSRVVPPDNFQAEAMVDVVKKFGWTYVNTLADEGNYGEKGIAAFEELAEQSGICTARSQKIPRTLEKDTISDILRDFSTNHYKARIIVMFVNEDNCRRVLETARQMGLTEHFYWLASDSWGAKSTPVEHQEWAAEGAVTILPQRTILKDFDDYFTKLTPKSNKRNPWFREFWEKHFQCTWNPVNNNLTTGPVKPVCTGNEVISRKTSKYVQEGLVPFVVDAVEAMAYALHDMHKALCPRKRWICSNMLPLAGPRLLEYIRNTSFIGMTKSLVKFNANGDPPGRYTIYQYQKKGNNKYGYIPIGNWQSGLQMNLSMAKWKNGSAHLPTSVCSEPCPSGSVKSSEGICCWTCIPCDEDEILVDEFTCFQCPNGSLPDSNKTACEELPVKHLELTSIWGIIPVIFSSLGIVVTLFVVAVFIRFNKTPVIMASGRELCYVLLSGFICCYGMTFIMVAKPTVVTCTSLRLGLGLSLSICYAALFTKTNRISRIFNRGVKAMVKRPSYTSPKSQLMIVGLLVAVQCMGALTWIGMDLPGTTYLYPDRETVVLRCKSTNFAVVMSLLYNMILIILCTVYAFKTRKIPENYNEAKYIAFTMYSTCIVWLAFIPIYFGTKNDFKIQITALCMCVSISATVALGCLFAPKVYIVLFQPHKNVRQHGVASALNPSANRMRAMFGMGRQMNGNITSPTGLALLIAQGSVNKGETDKLNGENKSGPESDDQLQSHDELDSIKDLDSSGPEHHDVYVSEPETRL